MKVLIIRVEEPSEKLNRVSLLSHLEPLHAGVSYCLEKLMRTDVALKVFGVPNLLDELREPHHQEMLHI